MTLPKWTASSEIDRFGERETFLNVKLVETVHDDFKMVGVKSDSMTCVG